jgi:hypothetical protein
MLLLIKKCLPDIRKSFMKRKSMKKRSGGNVITNYKYSKRDWQQA